jgi:hypothetical protein
MKILFLIPVTLHFDVKPAKTVKISIDLALVKSGVKFVHALRRGPKKICSKPLMMGMKNA